MIQALLIGMLMTTSGTGWSPRPGGAGGLSLLLLATLFLPVPVTSLSLADFYPFNATFGDIATERSDDGGSGEIAITTSFPFFNRSHHKLFVNNNGVITFQRELTQYRPQDFPLQTYPAIIAPFWADVDVKVGGVVWYRESQDSALLQQASDETRKYFPGLGQFQASWTFLATWDQVGYYGAVGDGTSRRNTFQCVLITNGVQSFVIFNYHQIQWTTGSNSGGATASGLGGNPAQVGFDAGDGVNFAKVEGAGTDEVLNLTLTSNVGIAGKWAFRVDSDHVQGPQEGTTQSAPTPREARVSSDVTHGSDVIPGSSDVTTRTTDVTTDTRTTQSIPTPREARTSSDVTHGSDVTPGSSDVTKTTTGTTVVATDTSDSPIAIAALSVALVVFALVILVAVVVVCRRRMKRQKTKTGNGRDLISFPSVSDGSEFQQLHALSVRVLGQWPRAWRNGGKCTKGSNSAAPGPGSSPAVRQAALPW